MASPMYLSRGTAGKLQNPELFPLSGQTNPLKDVDIEHGNYATRLEMTGRCSVSSKCQHSRSNAGVFDFGFFLKTAKLRTFLEKWSRMIAIHHPNGQCCGRCFRKFQSPVCRHANIRVTCPDIQMGSCREIPPLLVQKPDTWLKCRISRTLSRQPPDRGHSRQFRPTDYGYGLDGSNPGWKRDRK